VDLLDTLRSTGAVREFAPDPVPDEVLARVLDTARFAPSGGNRQGWRVVVVRDEDTRRRLRDLYLDGWYDYLAIMMAGLTPWAPVTDRAAEASALAGAHRLAARAREEGGDGFAEQLDQVPVLLALFADLRALAAVDRDHARYTFAGGASIYPFAWNLLLAARAEGLGGVITTMPVRREEEVKSLLRAPDELALAAVVALGHPKGAPPTRLRRAPVASFTTVDRIDGPAFGG
jgi:nitroreductase